MSTASGWLEIRGDIQQSTSDLSRLLVLFPFETLFSVYPPPNRSLPRALFATDDNMAAVDPATRKKVLRIIFVSLLLDLVSFTFILPLFPKLLEFYRDREAPAFSEAPKATLLSWILDGLNRYKEAFARPIEARYDIVLLGGAMGSLFS